MDLAVIEQEALKLPETDRAVLADHLLNTLGGVPDDVMAAWAAEGERRLDVFELGEMPSVDGAKFVASLRKT